MLIYEDRYSGPRPRKVEAREVQLDAVSYSWGVGRFQGAFWACRVAGQEGKVYTAAVSGGGRVYATPRFERRVLLGSSHQAGIEH